MKTRIAVVLLAASSLLACGDSQAGSDYPGEPLMTLRGVVHSSPALGADNLVPALVFESIYDRVGQQSNTTYFVSGDVEGEFPSAFALRVYEPPHESVVEPIVDGEPAFAIGSIVAMAPNHPKWLRRDSLAEPVEMGEIQVDHLCSDTGECLMGKLSECQEGEQSFSLPWPCGAEFPDALPWEIYGYSVGYSVLYVASPVAAGAVLSRVLAGGQPIAAGYHVVNRTDQQTLPADEMAAIGECVTLASSRAVEAVNRIYGTNYPLDGSGAAYQDDPDQFRDWDEYTLRGIAELGCKVGLDIVDSSTHPVELMFTDQPQPVGW